MTNQVNVCTVYNFSIDIIYVYLYALMYEYYVLNNIRIRRRIRIYILSTFKLYKIYILIINCREEWGYVFDRSEQSVRTGQLTKGQV